MNDNFSRGFWRRAGQNTADRLSNAVFGDNWARPVKHLRAETASRKQSLAESAHLDSVHSAVLANADAVRGIEFEGDVNGLVEQLHDMSIQLKSEGWKSIIGTNQDNENQGKENRIHNKFTDTLYAKYKRGLTLLERQDPFNRDIWYFKWVRYTAGWRKFIGKYWFLLLILGCFLIGFVIWGFNSFTEWYDYQVRHHEYPTLFQFWACVILVVLLRIYIGLFNQINALISRSRKKRKKAQLQQGLHEQTENVSAPQEIAADEDDKPIDPNTIMQDEHEYLWEKYGNANDIMKRGYNICRNTTQKDILIVGYNPSFNKSESIGNQPPYELPDNPLLNQLLVSPTTDLRSKAAYIDLFSFRESDHAKANQQVVLNPQMFSYVVEQVCLTQNMIEELIRPKLIIVLNQDSWAYFGKLPEFTWMGYRFLSYPKTINCEIWRIVDYSKKPDRINIEREQTNIKNSLAIFLSEKDKVHFPTPEDLAKLLK